MSGFGLKASLKDIEGEITKQDERYVVMDRKIGEHLIISSTRLNPKCKTSGHDHATQDEVYMFLEGAGVIEVGSRTFEVESGDIVLIEAGEFHRVHNTAKFEQLYFMCVFNGKREKTSIGTDAHGE